MKGQAPVGETVWFIAENGMMMSASMAAVKRHMAHRFRRGELRRVNEDGSPWEGDPLAPAPPQAELIIGTLRGYRHWEFGHDGELYGRGSFEWVPGGWTRAACKHCAVIPGFTKCGYDGYGCGLYAAWTPAPVATDAAWGVVEARGRTVAHPRGFRAEQARVVALCAPQGWAPVAAPPAPARVPSAAEHRFARLAGFKGAVAPAGRLRPSPWDAIEAAALRYGVPLLPRAALEAEFAPDNPLL